MRIKLHYPEAGGIVDRITKDHCSSTHLGRLQQHHRQRISIKNVVSKDKRNRILSNKRFTNQKRLCESVWLLLHRIGQAQAKLAAIPQYFLKNRDIPGGGND